MTTVSAGTGGIKLFLKTQIMESVYRFEDSGHEILSMELQNLYINRTSVIKDFNLLEQSKCMVQYPMILDMLQMPLILMVVVCLNLYLIHYIIQTKKHRKRIAKLTTKNVIDDLGMQTEDEGCCIAQISNFCQKSKVI